MGTSTTWMGLVAALGVRLAARGRVVPQLASDPKRSKGGRTDARVNVDGLAPVRAYVVGM